MAVGLGQLANLFLKDEVALFQLLLLLQRLLAGRQHRDMGHIRQGLPCPHRVPCGTFVFVPVGVPQPM